MKSCSMSNYLQRDGFVMVSNLLITYQKELQITDRELNFIIKVTKHKENYKLHDDQLDPGVSARTLQRCRKSLTDKGYLNFKVWKYTDEKGHIHTEGITYDFSPLELKLQEISDFIAAEKESQINKEAENYIIEFGEDSPMAKYLKDWESHYGDIYRISPLEKQWYNGLSEEEQKYIGRIFDYCVDNKLFKEITPRLSLFMKTKTRWVALKEYADENEEENIITYEDVLREKEEEVKEEKSFTPFKVSKKAIIKKEIEETQEKLNHNHNMDELERMVLEQFVKDKLEELNNLGENDEL